MPFLMINDVIRILMTENISQYAIYKAQRRQLSQKLLQCFFFFSLFVLPTNSIAYNEFCHFNRNVKRNVSINEFV